MRTLFLSFLCAVSLSVSAQKRIFIPEDLRSIDDYFLNETLSYIREGLGDFCADDGVPISMKALLYNRFCHWGWCETPDTFRSWYEAIDYTNVTRKSSTTQKKSDNLYCPMLMGAVLGDIAGSIYEFNPHKSTEVELKDKRMDYTDDTIMTIAVADWILNDKLHTKKGLIACMQKWGRKYPHPMGAYGNMFSQWLRTDTPKPYNSWGNGAAMRVSAIGFAFDTLELTISAEGVEPVKVSVLQEAKHVLATAKEMYPVKIGGETIAIGITANVKYSINIAEDGKSWIKHKEYKDGSEYFEISAFDGQKRSAKITFTQTDAKEGESPLSAEVTITQQNAIISWAVRMNGNRLFPKWESGGLGTCYNFTLECLIKPESFKSTGAIMTIMGIEGQFLLRFGDVGNSPNRIQIATTAGNWNIPEELPANRWTHVAITFGNKVATAYFNGVKIGEYTFQKQVYYGTTTLQWVDLSPSWSYEPTGNRCFWIGYSYESNRAGLGDYTYRTSARLQDEIRNERARELFGEFQRKYDLVRWGIWYQSVMDYSDYQTLVNNLVPCREYYPIPDKEVVYSGYALDNNEYKRYGL